MASLLGKTIKWARSRLRSSEVSLATSGMADGFCLERLLEWCPSDGDGDEEEEDEDGVTSDELDVGLRRGRRVDTRDAGKSGT